MALFEKIFKRKKEEEEIEPPAVEPSLPRELEDFRLTRPPIEEKPSPFERPTEKKFQEDRGPFVPQDIMEKTLSPRKPEDRQEKLDLILSKLETIDARLRLIEEKLK